MNRDRGKGLLLSYYIFFTRSSLPLMLIGSGPRQQLAIEKSTTLIYLCNTGY